VILEAGWGKRTALGAYSSLHSSACCCAFASLQAGLPTGSCLAGSVCSSRRQCICIGQRKTRQPRRCPLHCLKHLCVAAVRACHLSVC